jgi:hypothetical protein
VYRLGICDRLFYKGAKERENLQGGELFGGHHWQRFLPALSACMASVSCLRVNNKRRFLSRLAMVPPVSAAPGTGVAGGAGRMLNNGSHALDPQRQRIYLSRIRLKIFIFLLFNLLTLQ